MANEPLGIVAELADRRARYARFAYIAPHDRLPKEKPVAVPEPEAEIVVTKTDPVPLQLLAVMRKFCMVYSEISGKEYTIEMMKSAKRTRALSWPRHVCIYLASKLTGMTTTPLGKAFGRRDHTSVVYACEHAPAHMVAVRELLATHDAVMAFFKEARK